MNNVYTVKGRQGDTYTTAEQHTEEQVELTIAPGTPVGRLAPHGRRRLPGLDFARIARFVICYFPDAELLLGAPWAEYARLAGALDMDVLRLPIVEGFVPPSTACMRAEMARVVQGYTLKGEDMLVHCQGELSRAGVVAGCWLLRLGVSGSFPEAEERGSRTGRARQTQGRRACARSRRRLVC
jgi:hypothetical protein